MHRVPEIRPGRNAYNIWFKRFKRIHREGASINGRVHIVAYGLVG